jgi:hypothetical protein
VAFHSPITFTSARFFLRPASRMAATEEASKSPADAGMAVNSTQACRRSLRRSCRECSWRELSDEVLKGYACVARNLKDQVSAPELYLLRLPQLTKSEK